MLRRLGLTCLLVVIATGQSLSINPARHRVSANELDAMVGADGGPALARDADREIAPTTSVTMPLPVPPPTIPSGPVDPPPEPPAPPLPLRPPRMDVDFPDPSVVWGGDLWYAFATNSGPRNVQVSASPDLVAWTPPGDAAPVLPSWAAPGSTWAPTVAKVGDHWVLYVSLSGTQGQCIDRLVASSPRGPYAPVDGGPLVCDQTGGTGAIDPSVLVAGGVPYLYWKAAGGRAQQLFGAPLTSDGLAFAGLPRHLLGAGAGWQRGGIENPSMVAAGGTYWLVYSGAYWATSRYAMGYAQCDTPLGQCHERSGDGPWVASADNAIGPGGGSVFTGPDGLLRLAFHSWAGGTGYSSGGRRVLHIETIDVSTGGPRIIDRPPTGGLAPLVLHPDGVHGRGLAVDPDTPFPVAVTVYVDGREAADLGGPVFEFDVAPSDGTHRICVAAVDDLAQSRPVLGCQDVTITSTPFGAVDPASGTTFTGWAIAPATAAPINVSIYVDGQFMRNVPADMPRDDVAAAWPGYGGAHGFSTVVPAGDHTVCAYAVVDDNRAAPALGCRTTSSRS